MEVREEVRHLAQPLAEEAGLELVDVEFAVQGRHRILRVFLDKPGGVTVGDCASFSRRLSDCLDMNQLLAGSFHLEVSSPGLDRPIRTQAEAERFVGGRVSLLAHEPRAGRRKFDGVLLVAEPSRVGVRLDDAGEQWFDWTELKSVRLVVDPWAGRRSRGGSR
jgi:ribosome maturation factor RimP